jgi:predicted dehydrogenase
MHVIEKGQSPRVVTHEGPDGYGGEIDYMLQCVQNGKAPAIVTAHDGLTALEICEAEEESVRSGKVVRLG